MAKLSTDDLLDAFKEMTLLELSEFVKQFEDTFDVKAAAPVAVAAPAAGGAGAELGPVTTSQSQTGGSPGSMHRGGSGSMNMGGQP